MHAQEFVDGALRGGDGVVSCDRGIFRRPIFRIGYRTAFDLALGLPVPLADWCARALGISNALNQPLELGLDMWLIVIDVAVCAIAHDGLLLICWLHK